MAHFVFDPHLISPGTAFFLGVGASALVSGLIAALLIFARRRRDRPVKHDLASILDALPSMVGYWDAQRLNRFSNRAYTNWFDVDPSQVMGMHIRTFHGDDAESILPYVERALRGQTVTFEQTIAGRAGKPPGHFLTHYVPDILDGTVRGFYALKHNITAIHDGTLRLAALMREDEGLLSTLHQHALVSVADCHGRITDANRAFCAISGYTHDELLGQDHRIVSSGTHPREFWQGLWRSLKKGKPWRGEICNRAKDGSIYWVDSIISPFFGEDGRIVKYISVRHDITAHKNSQRRLTESQAFLERVEKVSRVGGFMIDLASGAEQWTRQSYRIYEVDEGRPLTRSLVDSFLSPEVRAQLQEAATNARATDTGYDIEVPIVTAKGRSIWIRVVGVPEHNDGVPVRIVGAVQDITERRMLEQQLHEAISVAQNANRAKSEFLANMSHEIRTPLNAVIGLGYLLEQTTLSEDQRQFLTKIQFAGRALLGVINNVLDLSKIEAGEMQLENEPFDLPQLLRDLGEMLTPQAAAKGIELVLQSAADLPKMVIGDASRLRQILTNLVNNAIKFTQIGQVSLQVTGTELGSDRIRLRCEVKDTGMGVEPEALERLFTPFTQADASTTRRFGGTGLGLSIARRFVELMGGEIGVTSTPAVGSNFWIEVPLRFAHAVDDSGSVNYTRGLRIFVADSAGDIPEGLGAMVRALGWNPQLAKSCKPLLGMLTKFEEGSWPDVLILDAELLDTEACQLLSRLEGECAQGEFPPIIIVSTLAEFNAEQAMNLRTGHVQLMRPVSSSALFNAINSAIWKREDGREWILQSTIFNDLHAQWLAGVRVLAVDDSDINLEVVRRILEKQGATVATCSDGAAALEHLRTQDKPPDIVLMDVQMPVLDGYQAARRIRGELQLQTLPIVALTAGALVVERQRALEAGMSDFVSKPFDPQALIRKVRRLVEQVRGEPIPMIVIDKSGSGLGAGHPPMSSIDSGALHQMFGDDIPLFTSLLARVLREFSDIEAPVVIAPNDSAALSQLQARAHKLKGSAGMIGATRLMRLAGAVEEALQAGRSISVVTRMMAKLSAAFTALREESQDWMEAHSSAVPSDVKRATVSPEELAELRALLECQNLAAVEKFSSLAAALTEVLGTAHFDKIRAAVDNLDFQLGADLLREALSHAPGATPPESSLVAIAQ
jgi:PAS domain S-box-containing protein